jgi:hypothetical protein
VKAHYVVNTYILTDSRGQWWETLKADGSTRRFRSGTSTNLNDKSFKTVEAARKAGERNGYERFQVLHMTPPQKPSITWGQVVVYDSGVAVG